MFGHKHKHSFDFWARKEVVIPLKSGHHTTFLYLRCGCGEKLPFPEENYKIAFSEGTDDAVKWMWENL